MRRCSRIINNLTIFIVCWCISLPAWTAGTWEQDSDQKIISGDGDSFNLSQLTLTIPVSEVSNSKRYRSIDLRLEQTIIHWGGTTATKNPYYAIWVPIGYQYWLDHSKELVVRLTPGFMSDLKVYLAAITVDMDVSVRMHSSSKAYWEVGAFVNRNMGDANLHLMGAYVWKSLHGLEVKAGYPHSHVRMTWAKDFVTYANITPAGGIWKDLLEINGEERVTDTAYRNWQSGIGLEYEVIRGFWVSAEAGYKWDRRITAVDENGASLHGIPANSAYWQLGGFISF